MKYRNTLLVTGILVALMGCSGDTPLDEVNKCIDEMNSLVEAADLEDFDSLMAFSEEMEKLETGVCAILATDGVPEGIDMTEQEPYEHMLDRLSPKAEEFFFGGVDIDFDEIAEQLAE